MRDIPSPQVAWKDYKKDHPDEFRTPVKDENEFNWNHMDMDDGDHGHRGRGGRYGGRFGRRNREWDQRGGQRNNRGGGWNQDNGRWNNGRRGQNGPVQPFIGRGGSGEPAPRPLMGNNFPLMGPNGLPDLTNASPEMIRKEVIPSFVRIAEEGKRNGSINEVQFRDIMKQVCFQSRKRLYNYKCPLVSLQNPSTALNHHPS